MRLYLALPLLLCGCAVPFIPQPIEITDQATYAADVSACVQAAQNYKPQLDVGSIGAAAVNGAASNASEAVINPLVPAVGAAGGVAGSLATGFDLIGKARANVAKHCLQDKLRRDHAAIVADPD